MARLGFGYEQLQALKPDIVYVSNCGFGQVGPYRDVQVVGADRAGGLRPHVSVGVCPTSNRPAGASPTWTTRAPTSWPSRSLAALVHRSRTGEGQWIDMSCTEAGAALNGPGLLDCHGERPPAAAARARPNSNRSHVAAPWRRTASTRPPSDDRWVAVACRDDDDWAALAPGHRRAVGHRPGIGDARRPAGDAGRASTHASDEWTRTRDRLATAPSARRRRCAPVAALARGRIDHDPEHRRVGAVADRAPTREHGDVRVDGLPVHLSRDRLADRARRAAARRGQRPGARASCSASTEPRSTQLAEGRSHLSGCRSSGLRVVELATSCAAWAGKLLADLGADVIVVEPPGGSPAARYGPFARRRARPRAQPLVVALQHVEARRRRVLDDPTTPRRSRALTCASGRVRARRPPPARPRRGGRRRADLTSVRRSVALEHAASRSPT